MNTIYDKIYGCWLGKCIGGNIGAPYEGMKQRMSLEYSSEYVEKVIPNDDLDLQILWLDLLEEKGWDITQEDMAKIFFERCPYAPGEYAYFKKNYEKGIMPPLSGTFNNSFFGAGMGSPIRSEIWACLFYNDVERAIHYAKMDSLLDHLQDGESMYGEVFLTALECYCFGERKPTVLVEKALTHLPETSVLKQAIKDLMIWCAETRDMAEIQRRILRDYGHSESCMAVENICILIAAFLLHGDNFIDGIMEAVNCGFDADCTGATLGSILGILLGGKKMESLFHIQDMPYKLGVESPRTDLTASALTKSVYELSQKFQTEKGESKRWLVEQLGNPCISFGETKYLEIKLSAPKCIQDCEIVCSMQAPAYLEKSVWRWNELSEGILSLTIGLRETAILPEGLKGEIFVDGRKIGTLGLSVRRPFEVYGPYWKNQVVIPPLTDGKTYGKYIPRDGTKDNLMDNMRQFHLSCLPDESINDPLELKDEPFVIVHTEEDMVKIEKHTHFHGNAVYWFKTYFYVEEEMTTSMQIGRNTPIAVWLNDEFFAKKDGNETFYHEAIHKYVVPLKKGMNTLTFKIVKNTEDTRFSYTFLTNWVCSNHHLFKIVNPEYKSDIMKE